MVSLCGVSAGQEGPPGFIHCLPVELIP
jgi:hypothetical protein